MMHKDLEMTLNMAFSEARQARHELMTVEHLLLALLNNKSAVGVLEACDVQMDSLRNVLTGFIQENAAFSKEEGTVETKPSLGFQRVMQRALMTVQASTKKNQVFGRDVLLSIFGEKNSHAVHYLHQHGITRTDVVNYISHGIRKDGETALEGSEPGMEGATKKSAERKTPLENYTINLNALAQEGKIDPLIGREQELERVVQVLCRRSKNNPLLVGEAGVGKTAIAEGLALLIHQNKVPEILAESTIYALDLGSLLAGTKYRGDFENRLKSVLAQLEKIPHSVLFIDEIHTIIGAGAASGGALDASNLIKPALSKGGLRCLGATTFVEFRQVFERDSALSRRFQKIDVNEPTVAQTIQILRGLQPYFEDYHKVIYTAEAISCATELSARYINERFLPDKAIDVLDEAGAAQRIVPPDSRKSEITKEDIEVVVAKIARIPPQTVSQDDLSKLKNIERDLKSVVFGQDVAISALASAIKTARAGLAKPQKPIGSFLFSGPTGVGKTEVARQLAFILGIDLVRFDMSEYMERHTVSRLIGAPPGYVGFDQGGLLTEAINKKNHAVLLLDEIEKAHPDVFNLLLQVMDNGTLTDNNGRQTDFRNIILIMTTNAGAEALQKNTIGFIADNKSSDEALEIKRVFSPEFRNRIDAMIGFKMLSKEIVLQVVDKFLIQLEEQLRDKKVEASFSDKLRSYLAEKGFDPKMGARPMSRLIQDLVRKALADELLFGRLVNGGSVFIDIDDNDAALLTIDDHQNESPKELVSE